MSGFGEVIAYVMATVWTVIIDYILWPVLDVVGYPPLRLWHAPPQCRYVGPCWDWVHFWAVALGAVGIWLVIYSWIYVVRYIWTRGLTQVETPPGPVWHAVICLLGWSLYFAFPGIYGL